MFNLLFFKDYSVTCVRAKSLQLCLTLCNPMNCSPPGSSVPGILQARKLELVAMPSSGGSSQPRDWTQVSPLQADSLPYEPPGKPKNTGVGSLSVLQGNFLNQESNWGLPHCRRILYQLSYQGSLCTYIAASFFFEGYIKLKQCLLPAREQE